MTPDQQRIAIAEACGWTYRVERYTNGDAASANWVSPDGVGRMLPDYLNDLNACHEMEKVMNQEQKERYGKLLAIKGWSWDIWHATASQRAEAFLRVIGRRV